MVFIENAEGGYENDIPDAYQRKRDPFWRMAGGLLGLPAEKDVPIDDRDGANAAVRQIRAYEALRQPSVVTIGNVAGAVVEAVQDAIDEGVKAIKRVTKIDQAKAWLGDLLREHGQVPQRDIEEQGALAGHTARNLRIAKQRIGAKTFKKAGKWWWTLGGALKADG